MPTQTIDITGSGMSQQQENDLNEAKNKWKHSNDSKHCW